MSETRCDYCGTVVVDRNHLVYHLTFNEGHCPVVAALGVIQRHSLSCFAIEFRCPCGEMVPWYCDNMADHLLDATAEQVKTHIAYQGAGWLPTLSEVKKHDTWESLECPEGECDD